MISVADILATTAAIVGEPLPAPARGAEDSVSFLPAVLGDPDTPLRDHLIVHSADGNFAIRKGPWKWIEGEPVDEVKPGARKMRADEYKAQLYNTQADPAETTDVSAANPEIVKELRGLLNRYRDGGYSRALPPADAKPRRTVATLPPLAGERVLSEPLQQVPAKPWATSRGQWAARDGGVWGVQKGPQDQGASLSVPAAFADGVIDYELCFNGADRHSLRVEWGSGSSKGSFRIVVSRSQIEITKNPSAGEAKEATEHVARKAVTLAKNIWYPVRVSLKGNEATVQVNDVVVKGSHKVIGQPKQALTFLVFGESAGLRNVKVEK
jgi:hypothetical protein